jgi:hypothetical protein
VILLISVVFFVARIRFVSYTAYHENSYTKNIYFTVLFVRSREPHRVQSLVISRHYLFETKDNVI